MTARKPARSGREKMRDYRQRLRAQGLRPVQIWVPDTRAPGFEEELRRQCRIAAASPAEEEALDFIEAVADWDAWK